MNIMNLKPVSYSKFQTIYGILHCLEQYPEQGTNNENAFRYSFELIEPHLLDSPVGTLSEYAKQYPSITSFRILLQDGEVLVDQIDDKFIGVGVLKC